MIFRSEDIEPEKSGCLVCDDLFETEEKTIVKELLENIQIPKIGKAISGTFGKFNINNFENAIRRD